MTTTLDTSTAALRDELLEVHSRCQDNILTGLPEWTFDRQPQAGDPVVIIGSNYFASFFIEGGRHLNLLGVVDDFKKGESVNGIPCISSIEMLRLAARHPNLVCVNVSRWDLSRRHFASLGREFSLRLLSYEQGLRYFKLGGVDFRVRDRGPFIVENFDSFLELENVLHDDYSRVTLYSMLLFHLTTDPEYYIHVHRPYETLYFRSGLFRLSQEEAYVDCGACFGESFLNFLGPAQEQFRHAWLIEPDHSNLPKLEAVKQRYHGLPIHDRIKIIGKAVGAQRGTTAFRYEGGYGGCVIDGEGEVEVDALDDFVTFDPTLLKLDVEGCECDALRGGAQLIASAKPKVAVSAYHREDDLFQLVRLMKEINPDYRVGLRHHNWERFDTCLYFF
jgi:FkbM family methyltransferase